MGKDIGKDKEKQQRLHDDANHKGSEFTAEHAKVAQHEAKKGGNVACPGRARLRR